MMNGEKKPTTTATGENWEFSQWNDIRLLRTLNQMWSREHYVLLDIHASIDMDMHMFIWYGPARNEYTLNGRMVRMERG